MAEHATVLNSRITSTCSKTRTFPGYLSLADIKERMSALWTSAKFFANSVAWDENFYFTIMQREGMSSLAPLSPFGLLGVFTFCTAIIALLFLFFRTLRFKNTSHTSTITTVSYLSLYIYLEFYAVDASSALNVIVLIFFHAYNPLNIKYLF